MRLSLPYLFICYKSEVTFCLYSYVRSPVAWLSSFGKETKFVTGISVCLRPYLIRGSYPKQAPESLVWNHDFQPATHKYVIICIG
jgi:hypothetical protein